MLIMDLPRQTLRNRLIIIFTFFMIPPFQPCSIVPVVLVAKQEKLLQKKAGMDRKEVLPMPACSGGGPQR
jgi:hypothetical protein